jgi:Tol biopolymer transport system component
LWRVSVSGRETPKPLDLAGWGARYPAISQSGRRLAYTQGPGYDIDLWRYQAGSGSAKKFVQSTGHDVNPQFSPDGKQVVFVSDRTTGCREIWVAGADGKKQMQLTNDSNRVNGTPRWSPDGRWIAFDRLASDGQADVDVMDSSGGQRRRLTPFPSDESVPSWSRDGKWVYFRSNRGGRNEIWKIPFAGGEAVQVTDGGGYVAFESWDGKTLYYLQTPVTGPLFARPLDGGPARMIISGRIHNRAFSPTEDGIYYLETDRDPAFFDLKFYNLTTRQTRVVTKLDGARWLSQGLTVSPDRKTFLFSLGQRAEADLMLIENLR